MDALTETMAGAVQDLLRVSGPLEHFTGRAIDFPPTKVTLRCRRFFNQLDRGVPCRGDGA